MLVAPCFRSALPRLYAYNSSRRWGRHNARPNAEAPPWG
jgi:hypothetical protein